MTPELVERVGKLLVDGRSRADISNQLGVPYDSVKKVAVRHFGYLIDPVTKRAKFTKPNAPALTCQWLTTKEGATQYDLCGAPSVPGRNWCAHHIGVMSKPRQDIEIEVPPKWGPIAQKIRQLG